MHEADHGRNNESNRDDGPAMSMHRDEQYCATLNGQLLRFDDGEGPFYDDLTKQQLPTPLVKAARQKELDYFETKHVWKGVSLAGLIASAAAHLLPSCGWTSTRGMMIAQTSDLGL